MADILIVGAGLTGCCLGRLLAEAGFKIKIVEKDACIGGTCRTDVSNGIIRHLFGGHVFHTTSEKVWAFANRFAKFNNFRARPKAKINDRIYSFPINLLTLNQVFGDVDPQAARCRLKQMPVTGNLADYLKGSIGVELYDMFYKGYSTKQWGVDPENLPATLAQRTPIRTDFNDEYFNDKYQGIPDNGYTEWLENMVTSLDVATGIDFLKNRDIVRRKLTIYTGQIDEYFDGRLGRLRYRSLRFEHESYSIPDYQGTAVVHYPSLEIPFTRVIEHKHFADPWMRPMVPVTEVTHEYPADYNETKAPYYPWPQADQIYRSYRLLADNEKDTLFAGRLGTYKYINMDQAIFEAMRLTDEIKERQDGPRII